MSLQDFVPYWPHLVATLAAILSLVASGHAVLNKRDSRATVGWVGLIWLSPFLGPLLYYGFGINRIQRKARTLFRPVLADRSHQSSSPTLEGNLCTLPEFLNHIVETPLTEGNEVTCLHNGDEAFPEMIAAIESATISISVCTYIFDNDRSGRTFAAALRDAVKRGVQVRVLIDAMGSRYSFPPISRLLKQYKIPFAKDLPTWLPWHLSYMNLRNHRKLLVVDGEMAFTGGMNIREGNVLALKPKHPIQDLHFKLKGPVVFDLQSVFSGDWESATKERLSGKTWFPTLSGTGVVSARAIPDGPDADFEKVRWAILGAIAKAEHSIRILSPYFLPDSALMTFLNVAALSGISVEILIPEKNNLRLVEWAATQKLESLLHRNCQVYLTPPPFDHSKLMIVDDVWVMFGSSNWDPRSLRLNFELNIETYDPVLALEMNTLFNKKKKSSKPLTLEDLRNRPLWKKSRDGIARMLTPYL